MNLRVSTGHEVSHMSEEWLAKMEKQQTGYKHGMIKLLPEGWLIPTAYLNFEKKIYNFKYKPTDVVLMTIPKSGTTWTQEILWTMLHNPNLDSPLVNMEIMQRAPQIDIDMLWDSKTDMAAMTGGEKQNPFIEEFMKMCPGRNPEDGICIQSLEFLPDRRLIKTHLPLALFPKNLLDTLKVVYVCRNPKDVVVSMCHHFRLAKIHNYNGTMEEFAKDFMNGDLLYCPYWPHVKMAWEKRQHPNFHFMFFEDMKKDINKEVQGLNEFLGTGLSKQQLDNVIKHTSFSAMKDRNQKFGMTEKGDFWNEDVKKAEGGFFRKGEAGDWKNAFSPELAKEMDQWIQKNASEIGITFK